MVTARSEQLCPECAAPIPVHAGFLSWCDRCGWNLTPPPVEQPRGRLERLYASAGKRLGDRLAARLLQAESLEPKLTPGRVGAYAIAVGVFAVTIAMFVGGLLLVVLPFPNVFAIMLGLALAITAFVTRPRLGRVPDENVVSREEAPQLFALADRVAGALETKPADVIEVSDEFNASWQIVGLRRRRVLTLGLPLLVALEPQERVAVVAHELAHGRNGDSRRGLVVGSAVDGLGGLYTLLSPGGGEVVFAELSIPDRIANLFLWVVSRPALGVLYLELLLVLRDGQRAEYQADALAAGVAGTDAVIALHEKFLLAPIAHGVAQRLATAHRVETSIFDEIAHAVADVPERERERRRRVARLEDARLDATHPPTAFRIRLLEGRTPAEPHFSSTSEEARAIDAELARFRPPLQEALLDARRDRLYHRYA